MDKPITKEHKKQTNMHNYINKEYYLPILKEFCEKTMSLYECGYPQGPFIPYTMPNYKNAPFKIMYVGRDTWEWTHYNVLIDAYKNGRLNDYLEANIKNVDVDIMLKWKNKSKAFWTFVDKLHLLIRTNEYVSDLTSINKIQKEILNEVGYGNLYSIEIPATLKKRIDSFEDVAVWDLITNKEQYQYIREAAKPFETLRSMIEAYNPDYIFVLTWIDKDDFFEGTDFQRQENMFEDKFRAVYSSELYQTRIIWSLHPNRFSFEKTEIEEMCYYLAGTFNQLVIKK